MPPFKFNLPTLAQLTRSQKQAINETKSVIVTGVPGSGKTVVSIYRLLSSNANTELITYTRMLKTSIAQSAITSNVESSRKINSIHAWYWAKTRSSLIDALDNGTVSDQLNGIRLRHLIVDEAQDMELSFYRALAKNSESVSIGADDDQKMYDVDTTEYALRNIFNNNIVFELGQNFRNRFEIFNFARQFLPDNPRANDKNILNRLEAENSGGELPYVYISQSEVERTNFINRILDNNRNKNTAILVFNQFEVDVYYRIISGLGYECSKYHSSLSNEEKLSIEGNLKNIVITTFHSSKGLEFDIVIMPSFERPIADKNHLYYVGCTRAKDNLFIIATQMPAVLKNFNTNTFDTE
jgi:superfamily I DNA/RNA helicase